MFDDTEIAVVETVRDETQEKAEFGVLLDLGLDEEGRALRVETRGDPIGNMLLPFLKH